MTPRYLVTFAIGRIIGEVALPYAAATRFGSVERNAATVAVV